MHKTIIKAVYMFIAALSQLSAEGYNLSIKEHSYGFATYYLIESHDSYPGQVKKSQIRIRNNYDLSNEHGWQATGITRVLSPGSLASWAQEIDIYDTHWNWIGMIRGDSLTTGAAKFLIYDVNESIVAHAFIDHKLNVMILDPANWARRIAHMQRDHNFNENGPCWSISVYDPESVDERIIRIFSAFIVDLEHSLEL